LSCWLAVYAGLIAGYIDGLALLAGCLCWLACYTGWLAMMAGWLHWIYMRPRCAMKLALLLWWLCLLAVYAGFLDVCLSCLPLSLCYLADWIRWLAVLAILPVSDGYADSL
jgi:hypothetical protein